MSFFIDTTGTLEVDKPNLQLNESKTSSGPKLDFLDDFFTGSLADVVKKYSSDKSEPELKIEPVPSTPSEAKKGKAKYLRKSKPKKENRKYPGQTSLEEILKKAIETPLETESKQKNELPKDVKTLTKQLKKERDSRNKVGISHDVTKDPTGRISSSKGLSSETDLKKILEKSVITPDFENLHSVPPYEVSQRKLKIQRKLEREKTKGKGWFGMPATEKTEEIENDLKVLQMRSVLDSKRFYKKNDLKVLPKYFQVGKIMDSPLEYYNNRVTKKQRKKTLVDELLADAEFQKYNKRRYKQIIEDKSKKDYKLYRESKKIKKKNKAN